MITRQSTARTILVGPVLDSTGAAKTDEVVGSIKITKNGTVAAADGSATLTHDHAGKYRLALTANDCDTVGVLEISLDSGTNDMPVKGLNVVETVIWDALFADGATGLLPANMTQIGGDTQSATDLKDFADAGYDPSTNKLTGAVELDPASLRSALGMSAADLDDQLDAILAAASAGAGTGARTVTITVNDGATALQNAVVRFTEGSNTFRALTNASGVATFNLDDATYTVAVTKSGYTYAGTTMVVNGTETATYSMTATNVTSPTNPDLSAIEVLCLDEDFEAASGIDVDFRMSAVATGDQNRAHPGAKKTVTSNGSGIARFEGPQGATIEWKRGSGQVWTAVTLDNDSVTNVTSLIGSP